MASQFTPPRGQSSTPDGWAAQPGTHADPLRPAAPTGAERWLNDIPASMHRIKDSAWVIVGGGLVLLGSLLPLFSVNEIGFEVNPVPRTGLTVWGLIVLSLGIVLCWVPRQALLATAVVTLILTGFSALGLAVLIVVGWVGAPEQIGYGLSEHTFSPGIGVILGLGGFAVACAGAAKALQHHES